MSEHEGKISPESAKDQFENLLDYYFLSFDDIVKADGKAAAQTMENLFLRAIQKGKLSIDLSDGLKVNMVLSRRWDNGPSEIIFDGDKVATARIAMGKITGEGADEARQNTFMGCLADLPHTEFEKLKGGDLTIYTRLAAVFSLV
jgi:hypothetical protein